MHSIPVRTDRSGPATSEGKAKIQKHKPLLPDTQQKTRQEIVSTEKDDSIQSISSGRIEIHNSNLVNRGAQARKLTSAERNPNFTFDIKTAKHVSIYTPGNRPALELRHNFAFVLNVSRLVGNQSAGFALAPGTIIRRANKEEIVAAKDVCKDYGATDWSSWECDRSEDGKYERLPESRWRYFVIAFTGLEHTTIAEIERTLTIATCDIKIGFTLMKGPLRHVTTHPTIVFYPSRLFHLLQGIGQREIPFVELAKSDAKSIRALRSKFQLHDNTILNEKEVIQQILDLEELPPQSPLQFLGYFAVLESLLTHQPKKTDTIDSITRQIIRKVILLDNRWDPHIDYGPFQGAKQDTIWSAMYRYRSSLAHGGAPDFNGELHVLGNRDQALKLLKYTVKGVLRQSLIEPRLIVDLRNC